MSIPINLSSKTNLPDVKPRIGGGLAIDNQLLNENRKNISPNNPNDINPYDVMNFTFKYSDPIKKYIKYDVPVTRFFDWDEERAQNQSTWEKWGRGITKGLSTGLGAVVENTLGVVAGLGEMITGGRYYDNFIGKSVDKWNDHLRETLPNYRTEAEERMTLGQKLGTANFWADSVLNGFGYSLGSLATFWLTGGVGATARVAGVLSKGQKLKGAYNTAKAVTTGTQLAKQALKGNTKLTALNTMELGLYMSLAEASVEAREAQKSMYQSLVQKTIEESNGLYETELQIPKELREDMLNASYSGGNATMIAQLPVLMGTNLFMFSKHMLGYGASKQVRNILGKDVIYDQASKKVINALGNRGTIRSIASRLTPAGKGAAVEAFQEGWQFASKVGSTDYYTDKYFDGGSQDMIRSLYEGIEQTLGTQEGLESILIGGIVGGGMGGGRSIVQKPYKKRVKNAEQIANLIDGGFLAQSSNRTMRYDGMVLMHQQMEEALEKGDIKRFKDAQGKLLNYHALDVLQNGGFDVLMEKLDDAAQLSDEEFAKFFGYNPEKSIAEQTKTYKDPNGQTKEDIVKKVKKRFNNVKEAYDKVHKILPLNDPGVSNQAYVWGATRMMVSEEKRKALEEVNNRTAALRAQLILGLSDINSRNERMDNIKKDVQALLDREINLVNGTPLVISNPLTQEQRNLQDADAYNAETEINRVRKDSLETLTALEAENANPLVIAEYVSLVTDYLALLRDNQSGVESYNKLSSSKYFQDLFEEERKKNEREARDKVKKEKQVKDINEAKTEKEVKEAAKDAKGEVKTQADIKEKELRKKEQEYKSHYLQLHSNKSVIEQLNFLTSISPEQSKDFSIEEKAGLAKAIQELKNRLKDSEKKDLNPNDVEDQNSKMYQSLDDVDETKTPFEEKEEYAKSLGFENYSHVLHSLNRREGLRSNTDITEERFMKLSNLEIKNLAAESASAQARLAREEAQRKQVEDDIKAKEEEKRINEEEVLSKEGEQTNLFVDTQPKGDVTPVYDLKLATNYPGTTVEVLDAEGINTKRKIPVDKNGAPVEKNNTDLINGTPININTDLLLGPVEGTEVEFTIIENDWFVKNHKDKPTETQYIPIYVKLGNEYIGKLQSSPSNERAELVAKLKAGEKITVKISEVFASSTNINNAVLEDAIGIKRFYNPLHTLGNIQAQGADQNKNIVLAFMNPDNDVPQFDVMYFNEGLVQNKNITEEQIMEIHQIHQNKFDQIALIVPGEHVPGGKTRLIITSTANLSQAAQNTVINALKERDFSKVKEIAAVSIRKSPSVFERYLYHDQFENGQNYIVYYSNKLNSLVRINELEIIKGLKNNNASYSQVIYNEDDTFAVVKTTTTEKTNLNLEEDLRELLDKKKYHVDMAKANSAETYTSPVTGNTYDTYQHYLFTANELESRLDSTNSQGEGHNSIISIDVVRKGQSLYNNPMVSFAKETASKTDAKKVAEEKSFNKKSDNNSNKNVKISSKMSELYEDKCKKKK